MRRNKKRDQEGASAVEYGLIVAAIAAVIVLVGFALGKPTYELFFDTCTEVKSAASITATCT